LLALAVAAPASAQGPRWRLESRTAPTILQPGSSEALIVASALNLGDGEANGGAEMITVTDTLPAGLAATSVEAHKDHSGPPMSCQLEHIGAVERATCTYNKGVAPYERLEVEIRAKVSAAASSGEVNAVNVSGGETPASPPLQRPITVGAGSTPFGAEPEGYSVTPEEENGSVDTQAGSHPFALATTLNLNETLANFELEKTLVNPSAPALARNLHFHLPPGVLGNPTSVPQCSDADFATLVDKGTADLCPAEAAVGVAVVTVNEPLGLRFQTLAVPVFNLVPAPGEPARLGIYLLHDLVVLDTAVKSGEEYGVEVTVSNSTQTAQLLGSVVTLWGEPGAASHDSARGWPCVEGGTDIGKSEPCASPPTHSQKAFLTMPTACNGPLPTSVEGDSWPTSEAPHGFTLSASAFIDAMRGCSALAFGPSFDVATDQHTTDTPTGMTVDVKVPSHGLEMASEPGGERLLAQSAIKSTTVVLPQGVLLNPGAASGLLACTGLEAGLKPGFPEAMQASNTGFSEALPNCPGQNEEGEGITRREGAKVANVSIKTPLLGHELLGGAYLASQDTNPFVSPLVMYLLVHDPVSGTLVKLAGTVNIDPNTGQLSSTFANTPQVPFSELKFHFFDGGRAAVSTPPVCGAYSTSASFTPWSGGATATPAPEAPFAVGAGTEGTACGPQPFNPSIQAGPLGLQGGAFAPFTLNMFHPDASQTLTGFTMTLPPGMAARLASVTPCPEPQAAQGTCGPESLIGHGTTSAGFGSEPFTLPSNVYLTGPYAGAPFGLSVVTSAVAGPFNLGTVVVRSTITVDPHTAAVTINTALPTFVENTAGVRTGAPVALKAANVTIDRPGFEFNPTNCDPLSIAATLHGGTGGVASTSVPVRVEHCDQLPFNPVFTAETDGATSRVNGAALRVKVTSPGFGQTNIAKTKVVLPFQLPSRLTTIQKACIDATFEANPANCPEGSNIGTAKITTPVFKNPLQGPAYLVSHGGAAFPDVEFVLQGEGITIILDGLTNIHNGITTSTFEALPDAPFTTFETTLPEGPHSALAANGNLCAPTKTVTQRVRVARRSHGHVLRSHGHTLFTTKTVTKNVAVPLEMPTTITAQNGAVINQDTRIAVKGCPAAQKAQSKRNGAKHGRKASKRRHKS
jgi:hypothetical protein